MSGEWLVIFEGSKHAYATGGVTTVLSYSDGSAPTGTTIKRGYLSPAIPVISERLRPLDGSVEVSALDFTIHDTDGSVTDQFTRSLEDSALTFLTASVLPGDTSITVANGGAVASFPTDVWVNRECMRVNSRAGNTLFVTRGYYGTVAEAIDVDATVALRPELLAYPCTLRGRRARLYRVSGTTATLRWIGYVRNGPVVAQNGASFVVQCAHAWDQEASASWGSPQPAATLSGYDSAAAAFVVVNADKSKVAYSAPSSYKAFVYESRKLAVEASVARLKTALGTAGATNVFAAVTETGGELLVTLRFESFTRGSASLRYGAETFVSQSSENSGVVEHVFRATVQDQGALVRAGFALGGDDRATTIRAHVGLLAGTWSPVTGSRSGVVLTPVLVGELDDGALLELDPTGQSEPGPKAGDANFTTSSSGDAVLTFRGFARVLSKDPLVEPEPITWEAHRAGLPIPAALPMRSALRVDGEHWLDAVRSVLEDDSLATSGSDSRNWGWSGYDATHAAARDELGPVQYRTNGNATVGELVAEEAKLRGCCVTVGSDALLSIIDLRSPTLTETPAATITASDWVATKPQGMGPSGDGLVTDVELTTPLRVMTLRDAVALGRYGTQTLLKVASQSLRRDPRIVTDPIGYSMTALGKLLGRWRDELQVYTGSVPASRFIGSCVLGAVVLFESRNAPNRAGGSGFTGSNAKRAVVVGRHEDPDTNELALELLALPTVYGFAPCARVASISGAVLTLASGYAGDSDDYAGSSLTGYAKTANDKGAGWFSPGFVCELVLRDTATHTVEKYTVDSVDTAAGTITFDSPVDAAPTNWPSLASSGIVDVIFTSYGSTVTAQRLFAAVADESTRVIGSTTDRPRKWAP